MNYFIRFSALSLLLFSCNNNSGIKNNLPDPNDSTGQMGKVVAPVIPNRDSFSLEKSKSSFGCTRSKTVKDVDKEIKIFGGTMKVKMDEASFSASTTIKIKDGWWFSLDKKPDGGKVILDMKSVAALQIGKDEEVETGNPEYLESKKFPTSTLTILHIDSIPGNTKKMNVVCSIQIKDTTGQVSFPAKIEYNDSLSRNIPSKLTGDFIIDGIKWGLNPKKAKVIKDELAFHVVLVTEIKK